MEQAAAELLIAFRTGMWVPYAHELVFAESLTWFIWTEETLKAGIRTTDAWTAKGRLIRVLDENVFMVLRNVSATSPSLHTLRRLIEALAVTAT
ncbi:hypothetical protein ACFWC5_39975 [Streptomyces sp. NPDC060085]|uniref:hypothetical protein n=1 Tax=Streptomyces sp. NPDC060085 TaxID=3347054 RepID=UPI0036608747